MVPLDKQESPNLRSYLFFLIGQAQSQLGSFIVQFIIILWIALEYKSAFYLGLAAFAGFTPMILVTPFAGVLVDRWNRKIVIASVDFLQAIITLFLVYLFWTDAVTIWHILIVLGFRAIFQAFHMPATEAIVPLLVPRDKLSRINGLRVFMTGANGIIAPVMAALLLNFWEIHDLLLLDPLTFGIAVIPVLLIKIPPVKRASNGIEKRSFKAEFKDGFTFMIREPGLLTLVFLFTIANFCLQPINVLLPLFVIQDHSGSKEDLAVVLALFQVGYLLGSIFMMIWKGFERKVVVVVLSMLGMYGGILVIASVPPESSAFLLMGAGYCIMGLMLAFINTTILTLYQSVVPPDKLGRFTSMRRTLIWFTIPVSSILAGISAEFIPIETLFYVCATLGIISVACAWFLTKLPDVEKSLESIASDEYTIIPGFPASSASSSAKECAGLGSSSPQE
ncbi:MAG: MFS transporter [Candidatus Hodarchaeota archaeon]